MIDQEHGLTEKHFRHICPSTGNARVILMALLAAAVWISFGEMAHADSGASKNKAGNQLFEQGKYQDAEKAYLEAQAGMPGRPELSYNLGNSLIKQKKYDQALQSLRQAISKGNKDLQANGWYNLGNAQFDMGNFKDSAESYVQALRLDPADRDAKHNLELSLKMMQEQKTEPQQQQGDNKNQGQEKNEPKPQDKQGQQSQPQQGQKPANPQSSEKERQQGGLTKERALQILDALQNQELADQRKLLEGQARKKASGRDW